MEENYTNLWYLVSYTIWIYATTIYYIYHFLINKGKLGCLDILKQKHVWLVETLIKNMNLLHFMTPNSK